MSAPSRKDDVAWATVTALAVPKRGHTDAECEDAVAWRVEDSEVRVAVADGATESAHARTWARLLTETLAAETLISETTTEAHAYAFGDWVRCARAQFARRLALGQADAPWYVTQKVEQGAHAAVLALRVAGDGVWRADAVGDVVLFHLRGDTLLASWPIAEAAAFSNRPDLVSSTAGTAVPLQQRTAAWEPGDVILVVTDALAGWLLAHPDVLTQVAAGDLDAWRRLIDEAHAGGMTNDDVALVRVVLAQAGG